MSPPAAALRAAAVVAALGIAGCAARPPPEIPVVPLEGWNYVDGRTPEPGAGLGEIARADLAEGWRLLVEGRLGEADLLITPLLSTAPDELGVLQAAGFLALRSGRAEAADSLFGQALDREPNDGLAALGRLLTVLGSGDPEAVFPRLRRLAEIAPDSPAVTERLPALTLDVAERRLGVARERARGDSGGPAVADAYRAALRVIPDSDDLLLEAAEAAAAAGQHKSAREWFDAVAASPSAGERQTLAARIASVEVLVAEGRLSESLGRLDAVLADPGLHRFADLEDRARDLERRLEIARLAERYERIREAERATREQLAALLVAELGEPEDREDGVDGAAPPRAAIAIDIERSWAANLILSAVRSGYLRLFADHTFQPLAFVNRAELAESLVAALGALAPDRLEAARRGAAERDLGRDLGDVPPAHQSRDAAAISVELGLLGTSSDGTFRPRAFASGAEVVRAVHALRDLLRKPETGRR